ncbi:uncharacterized protein A1O5_05020 [Cladophialophora psammophila CBS 110553]|uniref:Xylanolytic transcriptional activator regulatory domain-containing protein n=1 Tax=Cladophialophora psammophila CBS 110553 TaxID=1182543 RepID=W9XLG8_9EURO|nr:uncharacterized protein A1O5_05020 [Cladophialophora psammophila CBS 110553]EXJ71214.1 hypothetical protein A1O5_05020 [Cladophialophora psammophila CBS 110553]
MPESVKSREVIRTVQIKCDLSSHHQPCTNCRLGGLLCKPHERKRPRYLSTSHTSVQIEEASGYLKGDEESVLTGVQSFHPVALLENRTQASAHQSVRLWESADIETVSENFGQISQREAIESPEYVAATETHVGRSDYIGNHDIIFREEMVHIRSDTSRLSQSDLELLQLQNAFELPQRSILASLIDSYFKYCSPWTPILEPPDVEALLSNGSSPLLLNAVLLAGSRVASSNILSASAEDFYRKSRLLFILGHETDAISSIIAVTLLQWYNPTGPEHISTSTSGFWIRIAVGLAYQIGLHKDPVAQKNKSLRRTGRPRTINLDDSDVVALTADDFPVQDTKSRLFVAFSGIIRLLADLTEHIRRKTMTMKTQTNLENALYRWIKDLPTEFHLFHGSPKRIRPYNFEGRQLLVPYFVLLFILSRHSAARKQSMSMSFVASSFVAGIFEDLLNRDELCHCGPVFTFYAFAAGLAQMLALRYNSLVETAEESLSIIQSSLTKLKKRWGSAEGALAALAEMKRLTLQTPSLGDAPDRDFAKFAPYVEDFGPELCKQYQLLDGETPIEEALSLQLSVHSRSTGLIHGQKSSVNILDRVQSSHLQDLNAEDANSLLTSQNNSFFGDLDPFGSWIDELELGLMNG